MDQGADNNRRAFVTGATGAVGTNLVRTLTAGGWDVFALHRSTSDTTTLESLGATLVEGDIADPESIVGRVPDNIDAFFHVAASLNLWSRHNDEQMRVNQGGTKNAVEAALQAGVGRFIHTSTISAYGRHDDPIDEDTPSVADKSFVCYEHSKWLAEQEVRKGIERGLDAVIINPCAIMGPGFTGGWAILLYQIRDGLMKALPPGEMVVNHIDEVVKAHIAAVDHGRKGENYILTGDHVGIPTLIRKAGEIMGIEVKAKVMNARLLGVIGRIADLVSKVTGKEPDLSAEMATLMSQKLSCNTEKAKRDLNYQEVPWETCLRGMHDWLVERSAL